MTAISTPWWPLKVQPMDEGLLRVLALLRIALGLQLLYVVSGLGSRMWFLGAAPPSMWSPISFAAFLPGAVPVALAHFLFLIALAGVLFLIVGLFTPVAAAAAFASIVVLGSMVHSFGKIDHGHHLLILLLFVLGSSPWGSRWSLDAWIRSVRGRLPTRPASRWPQWPLKVSMFIVGLLYATSAAWKLRIGGFLEPGMMARFLAGRSLRMEQAGTPIGGPWDSISSFIIGNPWIGDLLPYLIVALELSIILGILTHRLSVFSLGMVAMMHASIVLLSGLTFVHNMVLALVLATAFTILIIRERGGRFARWFPVHAIEGEDQRSAPHMVYIASVAALVAVFLTASWMPIWNRVVPMDPMGYAFLADRLPDLGNGLLHLAGLILGIAFAGTAGTSVILRVARAAREQPHDPSPVILLYDEGCGFSRRCVEWAKQKAPTAVGFAHSRLWPHPSQEGPLRGHHRKNFRLVPARSAAEIPSGQMESGAGAVLGVLRRFPGRRNMGWRLLGSMQQSVWLRALLDGAYFLIARNPRLLSRSRATGTTH